MSSTELSLWEKARVSHDAFNTDIALIASFCGGDGACLQYYLDDAPKPVLQESRDRYLSDNLQRLGLELETVETFQVPNRRPVTESLGRTDSEAAVPVIGDSDEEHGEGYEGDADSLKSAGVVTDVQTHLLVDKFLDRVAEFASTRHGAKYVVSAALGGASQLHIQEEVAGIFLDGQAGRSPLRLLLAKNEPFTQHEKAFLESDFPKLLQNITTALHCAKHHLFQNSKDALWEAMTRFSQHRVQKKYIPDFLKAYETLTLQPSLSQTARAVVGSLETLVKVCQEDPRKPGEIVKAVILAYDMRSNTSIQSRWKETHHGTVLRKVLSSVMALGRIRAAFKTFLEVCTKLPAFQHLESECLPPVPATQSASKPPIRALDELLSKLKPSKVKATAIRRHYRQLISQELHVHAEVQFVIHEGAFSEGHYSYIGGSKRPCFLCALFLQELKIRSKPSHGGLYTRLTLPSDVSRLQTTESQARKLYHALSNIQQKIQALRMALEEQGVLLLGDPQAQSSVGVTITELRQGSTNPEAKQMNLDIATDRRRNEEAIQSANYDSNCAPVRGQSRVNFPSFCSTCGESAARYCAHCKSSSYCSSKCYNRDRAIHEKTCQAFVRAKLACPGPDHRLCFFLPVDSSDVQVRWVPVETEYNDGLFEYLQVGELIDGCRKRSYIDFDPLSSRNLERTVAVVYRDTYLRDGSEPNRCVARLAGATVHAWRGPFLITRHPLSSISGRTWYDKHEDVCMEDLTIARNWFHDYHRTITKEPSPAGLGSRGTEEQVVRINCDRCVDLYGRKRFEERTMVFANGSREGFGGRHSEIAAMLGFPILVAAEHIDELEQITIADSHHETLANYIGPLHQVTDVKSEWWGLFDPNVGVFEDFTGNWIVRTDADLLLTPDLVENICRFCKDLQAAFERAIGPTVRHSLTREQVMAAICPENFRKAISKYKEGKNTWTDQELASWEV